MKYKYFFIGCCIVLFSFNVDKITAQVSDSKKEVSGELEQFVSFELKAIQDVENLKSSPLIVRLKDSKTKFDKMRKAGADKYIEDLERKQNELNEEVINGFLTEFNFNKQIYFIKSSEFKKWRNNEPACFMDKNQECDESIQISPNDTYFLAEFDFLRQSKYGETSHGKSGNVDYNGGPNLRPEGLLLRDSNMNQLEKPLPFFVAKNKWLFERKPNKMIEILNSQLHGFFNSVVNSDEE